MDEQLDILYWVPEQGVYVGATGPAEAVLDNRSDRLVVHQDGEDGTPVAVLVLDPSLARHQNLIQSALAVSALALENARLQTSLRAELSATQQARARLLHGAMEERRRLERDLHDGAQQRLLGIGLQIARVKDRAGDEDLVAQLEGAQAELQKAREELRDLARGIYPAVLTQSGLGPAIETVAERLPIPMRTTIPQQRWDVEVEGAAYMVICEALANSVKHAGPCMATVEVRQEPRELSIRVVDDGKGDSSLNDPASLPGLRDRVVAMGGRVAIRSTALHGTELNAWIPLAGQPPTEG